MQGPIKALLRLYEGSIEAVSRLSLSCGKGTSCKALLRQGSIKALLRLDQSSIKALSKWRERNRLQGSIKALLRLYQGSIKALSRLSLSGGRGTGCSSCGQQFYFASYFRGVRRKHQDFFLFCRVSLALSRLPQPPCPQLLLPHVPASNPLWTHGDDPSNSVFHCVCACYSSAVAGRFASFISFLVLKVSSLFCTKISNFGMNSRVSGARLCAFFAAVCALGVCAHCDI